jgi:asparagine synthase (glutamine-hydrolysing)
MCGIMGVTGIPSAQESLERVRRMGNFLIHRGPDAWGEFSDIRIGLGHARLSILDLECGVQPMISADGEVAVVFNGEIYNYRALWRELEGKGRRFHTDHSDTEVVLNGYREWGLEVFDRLEGMFGLAIWDAAAGRLVLARDRAGIKPLYYAHLPGGGLVFASEPKAILGSGLIEPSLDTSALSEYFTHRAVSAPRTLWRGISKLAAAHILCWSEREPMAVKRYWTGAPAGRKPMRIAEAAELIESELSQAVESHLAADVPVGIYLSGGVDSSLVAALTAARARPHAFTVGVEGGYDETAFAAEIAARFDLPHHVLHLESGNYSDALDGWIYFNDDPVSDPSALALLLLSREARRSGMKVMLSGEGADELFCGYSSYLRYQAVRAIRQIPLAACALRMASSWGLDGRTLEYLEQPGDPLFAGTGHLTTARMRREIFTEGEVPFIDAPGEGLSPLRRAMLFDQAVRLPNDILARTDRATMAAGIEARVPFLDRRVMEAANALNDACCLHPFTFETKRVLKRILRKYLPHRIVHRRKIGFDLPIAGWLRTQFRPMAEDLLSEKLIPGMNYSFWARLYFEHRSGRSRSAPLWAWLVLELWYRRWARPKPYRPTGPILQSASVRRAPLAGIAAEV